MKIIYLKYIQMLIIAVLLAIFLPRVTNTIFSPKNSTANVYYSEVYDEFMVQTYDPNIKKAFYYKDGDEKITLDEYLEALPFNHYTYLISRGKFPFPSWNSADEIKKHSQKFSLKPDIYNQKKLSSFTIFESNPKYLKLGYNEFILQSSDEGLKFTNLNSLKIDENLSSIYTKALKEMGFKFPIKNHYTNPMTRKPFDEGVFLEDKSGEIYHLKAINKMPKVVKTDMKDIDFILVDEKEQKEFYGIALKDDKINLINYDYELISLPSATYNPKKDHFRISITPLSKSIAITSGNQIYAYHLDDDFKSLKEFVYELNPDKKAQFIKDLFLPFELVLDDSYAYKFKLANFSLTAILLNVVLFLVMFYWLRNHNKRYRIIKSIFVLIFGIYGFIASFLV